MKKRRVLTTIFITIFLIAGISTVVLYKLGDRVVDEVIDAQISEIEKLVEATEDNIVEISKDYTSTGAKQPDDAAAPKKEQTAVTAKTPVTKPVDEGKAPAAQSISTTKVSAAEPDNTTKPPVTEPNNAVKASVTQQEPADQNIQITKDILENVKESVSASDKMTAATLILSKLSKSDINHLTELSAGGITPEEKAEMKDIVYSKFTAEEIQKIKEMYTKYMK